MRTLLICHASEPLNRIVLPRWLASFSELTGIVVLEEKTERKWRRVRRELKRVGWLRFADVFAFRLYYRFRLNKCDHAWEQAEVQRLCAQYAPVPDSVPLLLTSSPNSAEAQEFIRKAAPDIAIARCKTLLNERVFSIASRGTFVMHPGICPEYRNAHGCFWALVSRDLDRVGMTLLRIDKGVDTGPIFGYFMCGYDEWRESHVVIQLRTVFDNLEKIGRKLIDIYQRQAQPIDVAGRKSSAWGQPWLTSYLRWKRHAGKTG